MSPCSIFGTRLTISVSLGDATKSKDNADLIFTHPYAPLPPQLIGKPALINLFGDKKRQAERWVGSELHEIGRWGGGLTNTLYVANIPAEKIELRDLVEEELRPGVGFMPIILPMRVLAVYGDHDITVWDGFCGRGSIGAACIELGMNYIGIDHDPREVERAREYLGCD